MNQFGIGDCSLAISLSLLDLRRRIVNQASRFIVDLTKEQVNWKVVLGIIY